jgi:UDP-N-acetylmuramoyl-tripeptide--D-alanyl-D-alanine ligase
VIDATAGWVADSAGGRLVAGEPDEPGPRRAVIDTRAIEPGDLFVGLRGTRADGGAFAAEAIERGAWGTLTTPQHATGHTAIAADDPLQALQALARSWRRELGAKVIGVTGSTGKTSTKDILASLLRQKLVTHANKENLNTEIGLPLTILEAERGTQAMVLEMAMRGAGQIAELVAIAEPDVGVVVNVGPVHLELLGTLEAVAAAKAELIRDLKPGATAVVPANEPLLEPHLREDLDTIAFGPGGDVAFVDLHDGVATFDVRGGRRQVEVSFSEPHNLLNAAAAIAAAGAIGVEPEGRLDVRFSSLRGEVVELEGGVTVVNDCYNANPMSMRAALEHLAATPAERRLAVLGTMAELGSGGEQYHREIGALADELGIDVLITVGEPALPIAAGFEGEKHAVATPEEAGALLEELGHKGDRVLIKGSRSAGLERVLG